MFVTFFFCIYNEYIFLKFEEFATPFNLNVLDKTGKEKVSKNIWHLSFSEKKKNSIPEHNLPKTLQ